MSRWNFRRNLDTQAREGNVAKEVERQTDAKVTGTVEPYQGTDSGDLLPHVPNSSIYNRPDWTDLRPPASTRTQEIWAKIIQPYRATLLARLWLTWAWWRPVVLLLIIGTIAVILWIAISG